MLNRFNPIEAQLLGEGGEAQVYALDAKRIVRLYREGATLEGAKSRARLMAEIAAGAQHLPFATPVVIECGEIELPHLTPSKRIYVIEERIAGTSMMAALPTLDDGARERLIEQYMDVAWALGTLNIERPAFGELDHWDAVSAETFTHYLTERATRSLAGSDYADLDIAAIIAQLGEPTEPPAFVHLDYFAGNVMVEDGQISGVIDFGYSSIIGDRRMNVVAAAAHLTSPRITPVVTEADRVVARRWLHARNLSAYFAAGERWMAAYWMFARDDPAVVAWANEVFGPSNSSR